MTDDRRMEDVPNSARRGPEPWQRLLLWLALMAVVLTALIWGIVHWSYRASMQSKDAYILSLQRRVDAYRDAFDGASADDARRRLDAAESELRTLRLRLSPRQLSPQQRQAIIDRSRRPAGTERRDVALLVETPCSDCAGFADQIANALRGDDNWAVAVRPVEPGPAGRHALEVRVPNPTRPSAEAVVLQNALRSAGLTFFVVAGAPGVTLELAIADRTAP